MTERSRCALPSLGCVDMDWASGVPVVILQEVDLLPSPRGWPPMTATQWLRIRSFPDICSVIYVGNETRCHLCVAALCWMARTGVGGRPRTGRGLGLSPPGRRVRSGRLAAPDGPHVSCYGAIQCIAAPHPRLMRPLGQKGALGEFRSRRFGHIECGFHRCAEPGALRAATAWSTDRGRANVRPAPPGTLCHGRDDVVRNEPATALPHCALEFYASGTLPARRRKRRRQSMAER